MAARHAVAPPSGPPGRRTCWLRACGWVVLALLLSFDAVVAGAAPEPKRVLLIHSFGRDYAPHGQVASAFRLDLATRLPGPVIFLEATLDAGRSLDAADEAAFATYLHTRYSQPVSDLIVTIGAPAATFALSHRDAFNPGTPIVMAGLDRRVAPPLDAMQPSDALVTTKIEVGRYFENVLQLRPDTHRIAVVLGSSMLERYWRQEFEQASRPYAGRVQFDWYDGLSLEQMKARIAALPPDSAVMYAMLVIDGAGIPQERLDALGKLLTVAQVPTFSVFGNEIGRGVVGGPYASEAQAGQLAADAALVRLAGTRPAEPTVAEIGLSPPAYDWRELARWNIEESRLPPGSDVRYRMPSAWVQYRTELLVIALVMLAQALLIASLLFQRARRRSAEREARTLGGRLITAHEDEGRRLARELHDDVTQRLAGLSIEAATLDRHADPAARAAAVRTMGTELANLSRDVHALSYRLHPSVIDDLGLEEALRIECGRHARRGAAAVEFSVEPGIATLRGEAALCLFRVAQEALRNAMRHAQAERIEVRLRPERGGVELGIRDDGIGFDASASRERASLGLASMRERVALLGGRVRIRSRRGQGTEVTAWVPSGAGA